MKRWSSLLLDANVIIELFKQGIWDRVVAECDIYAAETVVGEAHFFEDDAGVRHDFDLGAWLKAAEDVASVSVTLPPGLLLLKLNVLTESAQEPGKGRPEQVKSTGPEKP